MKDDRGIAEMASKRTPNLLNDGYVLFPEAKAVNLTEAQVAYWTSRINVNMEVDKREGSIPGGYTYLGQFVSHDLVPGNDAGRLVLPRLNLDSVYGNKLEYLEGDGRFRLGVPEPRVGGQVVDVARKVAGSFVSTAGTNGDAFIADARNDENVIVAQIHLMFQKIHNELHTCFRSKIEPRLAGDAARKINIYIYHRLLLDDFLPRILAPKVADFLLMRQQRFLIRGALEGVPAEFSRAAFRLGHSMVRQRYKLRGPRRFTLDQLFGRGRALSADMAIDWDVLFGPSGFTLANGIDSEVAPSMANICHHGRVINIAEKNVLASSGLGSGAELVASLLTSEDKKSFSLMGLQHVTNREIQEVLGLDASSKGPLPLWIYFLVESMCHEKRAQNGRTRSTIEFPGRTLGPLASLIVGEVALAGMRAADFGAFSSIDSLELPGDLREDLITLLYKLGRITVQGLVREFSSCTIE